MVVELSVSTKTMESLRRGAAAIVEYKTACNSLELELIRLSRCRKKPRASSSRRGVCPTRRHHPPQPWELASVVST